MAGILWRDAAQLQALRRELNRTNKRMAGLEGALRDARAQAAQADRAVQRIERTQELDSAQRARLAVASDVLDASRVGAHVREAIAGAALEMVPCRHLVVENALPADFYALLIEAIPPDVFFDDRDPIKQNLVFPLESGPALTARAWGFMDAVVSGDIIREAVVERFRPLLLDHLDTIFGADARDRAETLPYLTEGGRLMLRRPGYGLRPHRDPKRAMLTCLLYLARPGDDERYGTQLFRVEQDGESRYKQTYYPEGDGLTCHLETTVAFRPNTMLVMLNSHGAHGVRIPADAPADLKRYSYQFYVAPRNEALSALVKSLPRERRAMWRSRDLPPGWWRSLETDPGQVPSASGR